MKKRQVLNLIKYHAQNNDVAFRTEAYEIAKSFDRLGDHSLAEYIMAQLSDANVFVPQMEERELSFFEKVPAGGGALPLPVAIEQDLIGIIHAVSRDAGVHKFLFQGPPGTGKTESAKQLARILGRELYAVDFASVVDSRLGQTQKNIADLFAEIRELNAPGEMMLLFDEIDSLALDRTNRNDLREMGRATSTVLKELDRLSPDVLLVATTNLFEHFDHALIRRFDTVIEFDRYAQEDLQEIAEKLLEESLSTYKVSGRNIRVFRKIMSLLEPLPYPGDLKNLIRSAVAFSDPSSEFDYMARLYRAVTGADGEVKRLREQGFTLREIELLTGVSKSQASRETADLE